MRLYSAHSLRYSQECFFVPLQLAILMRVLKLKPPKPLEPLNIEPGTAVSSRNLLGLSEASCRVVPEHFSHDLIAQRFPRQYLVGGPRKAGFGVGVIGRIHEQGVAE